jgi:pimeloyl-ACP methyl ester carboxylesterase
MNKSSLKSDVNSAFISSKKLNIGLRIKLIGFRCGFKILEYIAPPVAERMALRLFLSPPRHSIPEWQKPYLVCSKQTTIKIGKNLIKLYHWGSGPAILLVHGWGGRGSQLSAFITPLIEAGYSIITFDGPAHGESSGKQCDMFQFASVIEHISKTFSIHAIVAHSFGSACTLLALSRFQITPSKLVLIGCPDSAIWITEAFGKILSISNKVIAGMRKRLESRYEHKWTWHDLSLTKLIDKVNIPTLLIHDRNDLEIPYQQVLTLHKANPNCELFTTERLGHRRILRSESVINKSVTFIQ